MATNAALTQEHFNEVAAAKAATIIVERLSRIANETNTKHWVRSRPDAQRDWKELQRIAEDRSADMVIRSLPKRRAKPVVKAVDELCQAIADHAATASACNVPISIAKPTNA